MTVSPIAGAEARLRPALWFAKHGFHVLPVWSATPAGVCRCPKGKACDQPGKHPITPGGFHDATDDAARITTMLAAGSEPNYGLTLPAGCFALDVDGAAVGLIAEMEARLGPLPPTLTNLTAHGRHIVLRWPAELPRPTGNLFGIVTRWGGSVGENAPDPRASGYIIGPGSVHPSGTAYAFASRVVEIAELPAAWVQEATPPRQTTLDDDHGPGYRIPDTIGDGERYEAIVRYVASRYMRGIERAEMWAGVRDVLAPRMHPPLTETELRARFDRAWHGTPERLGDPALPPGERTAGDPSEPEPAATWRTLADVSDVPPCDLILGMFEDGPNLAYALGGTGKGTTGAWACGELIAIGMRPMIYDPENRPKEWARRVSGLGIDRSRVIYIQPKDLPRTLLGRPLWDVAPYLGQVIRGSGSDFLFVDSVLPAVGIGEERLRSDAQAPYLYVAALDALLVPSVSFGHPPKGQPEGDPFGSVSWTNAMRLTWLGTPAEGEGHWIRWRPRKRNERGHIAGVLLHVLYGPDGRPCRIVREDDEESTREWILAELGTDPRSAADLAAERADEDMDRDSAPTKEEAERAVSRMRQTLLRMSRDGLVAKDGKGRSTKWFRPDPSRLKLAAPW